jgi:hypothetical protein
VAQRVGGLHCADLVLAQTDFEQIERHQRQGRWDLVGDLLAAQGNKLKAAGADFSSTRNARAPAKRRERGTEQAARMLVSCPGP